MIATVLDTVTGKTEEVRGIRAWEWAENNWACDCNRNYFDVDTGKPEGYCEGHERFLVVAAEMDSLDDGDYTLAELNQGYPEPLLKAHGITL